VTQLADVLHTLGSMREEAYVPSIGVFQSRARAAMHRELARHHRPIAVISARMRRRLRLVALLSAGAAAALVTLGWVAPAGSSLYPIRLAHEHLQLLLPGVDRSAAEMSDAESRLADAADGRNQSASLDAAALLLAAARRDLPSDHASASWARWNGDEADLSRLRAGTTPANSTGAGGSSNSNAHTSAPTGGGDAPSSATGHDGSDGARGDDGHAASGAPSRDGGGGDDVDHSSKHGGTTSSWPSGDPGHPSDGGTPFSPEHGSDGSHH
jgi:hypothetical protein